MTVDQLRTALTTLDLTQAEFGELVGVGARSVRYYLTGEREIPPPVERLAWLLLNLDGARGALTGFRGWPHTTHT